MAYGMEKARAFCLDHCPHVGPDPVIIQGCNFLDQNCKTSGKNGGPSGEYQWRCYSPAAVNANHTEYKPPSKNYCSQNEEIRGIIATCQCKRAGGCPPYEL